MVRESDHPRLLYEVDGAIRASLHDPMITITVLLLLRAAVLSPSDSLKPMGRLKGCVLVLRSLREFFDKQLDLPLSCSKKRKSCFR